jgi:hypothetical protein
MLRERVHAWWGSRASEPAQEAPQAFDLESVGSLGEAARVFFSKPGPRFLVVNALASWGVRALLGPPCRGELGVAAAVVGGWPVQEWAAHRWLLHLEPREVGGLRFDPLFARKHRAHHRAPRDLEHTLLPMEVLRVAAPANVAFWLLASKGSAKKAATGIATYSTMALVYEWTHFLVHTGVAPRTAFAKRVRRNHRLHHYRHEGYWLSFTWPDVDRWLGTEPEPAAVPRSPTAQRLHGLDE